MGFSKLLHRFSKTSHHGEDDTSLGQAKDSRTPHTVLAIPADAIVSRRGNTPGLPSGINQEAPDTEVALSAATTPLLLVTPAETSVLEKSSGSPPSTVPVESPELSENAASLWSRAYVALQSEDAKLVDEYEKLLSRELLQQALPGNLQHNTSQIGNQIDNVDPDKRQQQLKSIMDRGLQKIDEKQTKYTIFGTEFVLRDQISQTVNLVQSMKGVIDEAVKGSPEASLAWAGVSVLLPILTNPSAAAEANRDGLTYVTSRIRYYVELETLLWPRNLNNSELKGEFDTHITDLYQHILKFQIQSVLRFYRKWILNIGRDVIRYDEWEKMVSKIKELEQIVKDESSALNTISSRETLEAANKQAGRHYAEMQSLLSVTKEILQVSQDHRDISSEHLAVHKRTNQILEDRPIDLPTVNEARYDSADVQDSPKCESGTRLGILKRIHQWIDEPSAEPLFWLVGPAGTGKSTIARTVADFLYENNRLAAGYFFKRGEKGRNDTARFFPTIAMQLVDTIPHFKNSLRKSLDGSDKTTVEGQGLKFQFEKLLLHPLVDISSEQSGISTKVIIIDAMDECERPEHLSQVLNLFCQLQSVSSVRLRVLLTSRSAPEIVNTFEELRKNKDFRSLELLQREFSKETQVDIHTFLEKRFKEIRLKRKVKQDPWPAPEDFSRLLQLATNPEPLFIYAATLCRFVYDEKRPKNPKKAIGAVA
ncbi:vegetative incompatibility protein het-e-1 [Colletotrichum truncatum]|uniref:Vegetative incompatibility protein het-e-1 n=1 Tax=Colletotrichum truncatum TaxID=5467 RepID=A0ACC3ZLL7_COLTU|nr:vegetative incompatibility protein het-e-1 [Colletotrichum truncatum]KAF6786914.1 vegetative incompatibility protein het-e-1 [Colletotrichum truncatum]